MLLSNCTTVDLVEMFPGGAEYCRLLVRATAVAAFGRVRADVDGSRLAAVQALLATAPAVVRRDSILCMVEVGILEFEDRKTLLPAPAEQTSRR